MKIKMKKIILLSLLLLLVACTEQCIESETQVQRGEEIFMNSCSENLAIKYSWLDNEMKKEFFDCKENNQICEGGACITALCEETDDGKDYGNKGVMNFNNEMYEDYCTGDKVTEFYCFEGFFKEVEFDCSSKGGKCKNGECYIPDCEDGDNGENYWYKSAVTIGDNKNFDECINENNLKEYYCKNNKLALKEYDCSDVDMFCSQGKCESDLSKATCFLGAGTFDDSNDERSIYHGSNDGQKYTKSECINKYFLKNEISKDYPCGERIVDDRPIINYKNAQWFTDPFDKEIIYEDFCDRSVTVENCVVLSDPSFNIFLKGSVMKGNEEFTDYCDDSETLIEYICLGDGLVEDEHDCTIYGRVCKNGKCVEEEEERPQDPESEDPPEEPLDYIELNECDFIANGGEYKLTSDLQIDMSEYKCLDVFAENIVIDCDGHTIRGNLDNKPSSYEYGININSDTNVVVKNCNIENVWNGIWADVMSDSEILDNEITDTKTGIGLNINTENNLIKGNKVTNSEYGIDLRGAGTTTIENNIIQNNENGVQCYTIATHSFSSNTITGNTQDCDYCTGCS